MSVARVPRLAALVLVAGGTLPLSLVTTSGCGDDQVCLAWTESDGACPSAEEAERRFRSACSDVLGVLGPGTFDDDTCCYPVEKVDDDAPRPCGVGVGGSGAAPSGPAGPSGPGAGPQCGGSIPGECGVCADEGCCAELSTCTADASCVACINDLSSCPAVDSASARRADALYGCLAAAQCSGDPCGVNPQPPPNCDPPQVAPSAGACAAALGCNPITGAGCNTDAGEACDRAGDGTFACFAQGYTNKVCAGCGATGWCGVGGTCYGALCARYCCDDGDCGTGVCSFSALGGLDAPVGLCVQPSGPPTSGSGGATTGTGGAGGVGASPPVGGGGSGSR